MFWIESHAELENHPKVFDLMCAMGWDLDQTIGKLHRFWWWCTKYALDGDLRKHNDNRIASAMGVAIADSKRLVEALVSSCWVDREPYFRVHDWWDYIGPFTLVKFKHSPEKWRYIKGLYKNGDSNSSANGTPNLPNLPNQKQWASRFEEIWKKYPNKAGKQDAEKRFLLSVKNEQDWADINSALAKYLKTERVQKGFIQDGSRWFGKWHDWLQYNGFERPQPPPPKPKPLYPGVVSPCCGVGIAIDDSCTKCRGAVHPDDRVELKK